jgi:hypothetical protein
MPIFSEYRNLNLIFTTYSKGILKIRKVITTLACLFALTSSTTNQNIEFSYPIIICLLIIID